MSDLYLDFDTIWDKENQCYLKDDIDNRYVINFHRIFVIE